MESIAASRSTAIVLVLGDVGRSPRMQYHAISLARSREFKTVYLVGYRGERCMPAVEAERGTIEQVLLTPDLLPRPKARLLYLLHLPLKAILQLLQLLWVLLVTLPRADVLLVQNPPAIPALAAAWLARLLRGVRIVVDWHNLGFSVLQMTVGRASHPFVVVSKAYERLFGQQLDGHLCVTAAMAGWLRDEWGVEAKVLHDRPPEFFRRLDEAERHALFRRLASQFADANGNPLWPEAAWNDGGTPWTTAGGKGRVDRPTLLVSSTSWTADEDFGVLLDALSTLDERLIRDAGDKKGVNGSVGPAVVAVITGKGPMKSYYEAEMRTRGLQRVAICTMWLEPSDYPALLGAADLGVCLHTSTSGLDLPMKVLDMYGCGLPVCAFQFACLGELVTHEVNGLVFSTRAELAQQLYRLARPGAEAAASLKKLRDGVASTEAGRPRWEENWKASAGPLLLEQGASAARPRWPLPLLLFVLSGGLAVLIAVLWAAS